MQATLTFLIIESWPALAFWLWNPWDLPRTKTSLQQNLLSYWFPYLQSNTIVWLVYRWTNFQHVWETINSIYYIVWITLVADNSKITSVITLMMGDIKWHFYLIIAKMYRRLTYLTNQLSFWLLLHSNDQFVPDPFTMRNSWGHNRTSIQHYQHYQHNHMLKSTQKSYLDLF